MLCSNIYNEFCIGTDVEDADTLESSPLRHVPPEDQEWHRQQERVPISCVGLFLLSFSNQVLHCLSFHLSTLHISSSSSSNCRITMVSMKYVCYLKLEVPFDSGAESLKREKTCETNSPFSDC